MLGSFDTLELPTLLVASATDLQVHPEYNLATRMDWKKVGRFLDGTWPVPWPSPFFLGADPKADAWWLRRVMKSPYVVFDVETEMRPDGTFTGDIIQVGLYGRNASPAIWDNILYPEYPFTEVFRKLITALPTVAHNAPFDVGRIRDNYGIGVWEYKDLHDTILMHALLWAEFPHGLEFITSVYSKHPKAKHLGVGNYDYLVGDVVGEAEAFDALMAEMDVDTATRALYYTEMKPLLPIIIEFMEVGVPVNKDFVIRCLDWIPQQLEAAREIAEAYTGYPVSLESGPQMRVLLDELEDVFSVAKRLSGVSVKKKVTPKGEISLDKDTVSALRSAFLPVDYNEELDPALARSRIEAGAHPLLEAKALWMSCRVLMSNYVKSRLIPLEPQADGSFQHYGSMHIGDGAPVKRGSV